MILKIKGLRKTFGNALIIDCVDLDIQYGEINSIIGPNGAGKSTLFNLITGLYTPTEGIVEFKGESIAGLSPFEINRKGLSRSFQINNIFSNMSVLDNIRCSLLWPMNCKYSFWKSITRVKGMREKAESILELIKMTERKDMLAGELTYADQRLLEIGITLGSGAELILLDEPTSGLSKTEVNDVIHMILEITKGKTLLVVEHDMNVVFSISDRISVLVYGKIIASGRPDAIRENKLVQEAYLGQIKNESACK